MPEQAAASHAALGGLDAVLSRLAQIDGQPRHVGKLTAHDNGLLEVSGFEYPLGYAGHPAVQTRDDANRLVDMDA